MPTQTKENYLKAIYFIEQEQGSATVSGLGRQMEVSTPTVNSMIKKLEAKGWVKYQKYKPVKLTKKGKLEATMIIRKHRLTEMFLFKEMGFGWEEVHDIAEEMEHLQNEALFDRMDEILNFPSMDPHGSPIPSKEGEVKKRSFIALSNYKEGDTLRLSAVTDSSVALLEMLNDRKIGLGTEITVQKVEAFDMSMTVSYDEGQTCVLSREACSRMLTEVVGN